ncbi:MAG: class I SAM-dependent methyltransferase [Muribaculaceae bacterium]|nr:class I SAM-dependent methyltransferase [Muribaculaceae bacterium]
MDERSFFDELSSTWDDNEILSTPEKIREILSFIEIQKNEDVLDLGTGTGVLLPYIAEKIGKQGKITAVDFSVGMLERAREKFNRLEPFPEFLNKDFEKEKIPGTYDHILLYSVYPHLQQPIATLNKLYRENLKVNGDIIIAFPCGPDFINNIHKERHSESELLPSATKLASILSQAGFKAEVIAESKEIYLIKIKR